MNVTVCDLCRREIEGVGASLVIILKGEPVKRMVIEDVCNRCLESTTSFLDGLKEGPPGVSMMLPDEVKQPEKKERKK